MMRVKNGGLSLVSNSYIRHVRAQTHGVEFGIRLGYSFSKQGIQYKILTPTLCLEYLRGVFP